MGSGWPGGCGPEPPLLVFELDVESANREAAETGIEQHEQVFRGDPSRPGDEVVHRNRISGTHLAARRRVDERQISPLAAALYAMHAVSREIHEQPIVRGDLVGEVVLRRADVRDGQLLVLHPHDMEPRDSRKFCILLRSSFTSESFFMFL